MAPLYTTVYTYLWRIDSGDSGINLMYNLIKQQKNVGLFVVRNCLFEHKVDYWIELLSISNI